MSEPAKPKRRRSGPSGPTQAEEDRKKPQLKLRLDPAIIAKIRAASEHSGAPASVLVELAWRIAEKTDIFQIALDVARPKRRAKKDPA